MIEIKIACDQDILKIQRLAKEIWWKTYSSIISAEQIQYMLDSLYSKEAIQMIMKDREQKILILFENGIEQGFASYGKGSGNTTVYKLHKLYVMPSQHKRGFGRLLVAEIKKELIQFDIHALELNVNRNNPARLFYEKMGFYIDKRRGYTNR